jgi:antirestriction protein ArdC
MKACSPGSTRSEIMRRNVGRKPQTSANLAAFLHITTTSRLLAVLRADNRAIFKAASQASKAADFLLAFVRDSECTLARAA